VEGLVASANETHLAYFGLAARAEKSLASAKLAGQRKPSKISRKK
jgi:hypothetical protein